MSPCWYLMIIWPTNTLGRGYFHCLLGYIIAGHQFICWLCNRGPHKPQISICLRCGSFYTTSKIIRSWRYHEYWRFLKFVIFFFNFRLNRFMWADHLGAVSYSLWSLVHHILFMKSEKLFAKLSFNISNSNAKVDHKIPSSEGIF